MKTRKNKKKLVLKKISISQLDKDQRKEVRGGVEDHCTDYDPPCATEPTLPTNLCP